MTRTKYESMSFEQLMKWAAENLEEVDTFDDLKGKIKNRLEDNDLDCALYILDTLCNDKAKYYLSDPLMGLMSIEEKSDIEHLVFEDEEG